MIQKCQPGRRLRKPTPCIIDLSCCSFMTSGLDEASCVFLLKFNSLFLGPICDFLDAEGRHGVNLEKNHGPPPFPSWGQVRAKGRVASSGSDEAASPSNLVVSSFYRPGVFSKCAYRKNINKACLHSKVLGSVFAISKGSLAALNTADWTTAVQQESLVLISVQKSKESCAAR